MVGTGIYFAAVREGNRAYRHVTLAFVFVLAVSITFGLLNDPPEPRASGLLRTPCLGRRRSG